MVHRQTVLVDKRKQPQHSVRKEPHSTSTVKCEYSRTTIWKSSGEFLSVFKDNDLKHQVDSVDTQDQLAQTSGRVLGNQQFERAAESSCRYSKTTISNTRWMVLILTTGQLRNQQIGDEVTAGPINTQLSAVSAANKQSSSRWAWKKRTIIKQLLTIGQSIPLGVWEEILPDQETICPSVRQQAHLYDHQPNGPPTTIVVLHGYWNNTTEQQVVSYVHWTTYL